MENKILLCAHMVKALCSSELCAPTPINQRQNVVQTAGLHIKEERDDKMEEDATSDVEHKTDNPTDEEDCILFEDDEEHQD